MSTFGVSLAFTFFIMSSKASFAIVYPSSRPKSFPLSTPSSNFSSIFLPKLCRSDFLPSSNPSSYARSHKYTRFALSGVVARRLRASLMSFVVAMVIKLKNESRFVAGVCVSTPETLAGWLLVCTVAM